jgi:hypothetical protein
MRKLLLGVVFFVLAEAGSPVSAAPAAPLNQPLKASQVACAERQLARVQRRMAAYGSVINVSVDGPDTTLVADGSILALFHTTLGGGVFSVRSFQDGLCYPLTLDTSLWYAGSGLFAVFVIVTLAFYGFATSVAGQPWFTRSGVLDD